MLSSFDDCLAVISFASNMRLSHIGQKYNRCTPSHTWAKYSLRTAETSMFSYTYRQKYHAKKTRQVLKRHMETSPWTPSRYKTQVTALSIQKVSQTFVKANLRPS